MNFNFSNYLFPFVLINFFSYYDAFYITSIERDVFDGCNFQGKESIETNVNCTKLLIPALWNDQANKRCVLEYIKGCQSAKIKQFCQQGASHYLKNENLKCEPLKQAYQYGMDFYVLCCNVCSRGKQAYLNRQSCTRSLPLNAELSQVIVQTEFENCCSEKATRGLQSLNDIEKDDYFEEKMNACQDYGCEHFCEDIDYDQAVCSCRNGYSLEKDGKKCMDIDECQDPLMNNCNSNQKCNNLAGSYECVNIKESEKNLVLRSQLDDMVEEVQQCKKDEYFDPHRNKCIELLVKYDNFCLNESCETSTKELMEKTTNCKNGYRMNEDYNLCEDIDECVVSTCFENQICVNQIGSFTCLNANETITCDQGLQLNGKSCDDINECLVDNKCNKSENCINLLGSFKCLVNNNSLNITNSSLQIRDVFNVSNHDQSETSLFKKKCNEGQEEDSNANCRDIDYCIKDPGICGEHAICHSSFGKAQCECEDGYEMVNLTNDVSNNTIKKCIDIDECKSMNDCSEETSTCKNLIGTYECECKKGYVKSSSDKSCVNFNECMDKNIHKCHHLCEDTNGSFECKCHNDDYILQPDNKTCVEVNLCDKDEKFCDGICKRNLNGNSKSEIEYVCETCDSGLILDQEKKKCISINKRDNTFCSFGESSIHLKNGTITCVDLKCPLNYKKNLKQNICEKEIISNDDEPLALSKRVLILPIFYVKNNKNRTIFRIKKLDQLNDIKFEININSSYKGENGVDSSYFELVNQLTNHNLLVIRPILEVQNFILEINAIYLDQKLHTSMLYIFVV